MTNPEIVIAAPYRTPVGGFGGSLRPVSAADLASGLLRGLIERTELDPAEVDEVILGNCNPTNEAPAIGRVVALDAGLPITTTGQQLDRRCGSGLQAILTAAGQIATGGSRLVLAGGTESMSNAPFYTLDMRWGTRAGDTTMRDGLGRGRVTAGGKNFPVPGGMLETAENLRREYRISREAQDELALESHRRAVAAQRAGLFDDEIIPVRFATRKGEVTVEIDEHPRADASLEALAKLRPILLADDPEATVTAGNASGQNDAAALVIVTTREHAERLGLQPLARLVSWAVAGVEPARMGIGPVPATAAALERAGLGLADIDLIELNEAFAAQALAVMTEWGFTETDRERTNVHGSGISLGHPVGATGARMTGHLARELNRTGARRGLVTMCIGGGQGLAAIFERVE
ncbi:acetyl-CoA C-acetyltransferase [Naumannella cuiyingiana]|uniref:Probable acetyl-CoA acetyltransferase n=1 Tax=Naumannella cuiyingiana TaxID=1347891 RepID=A0A7Z0D6X8_9ACTN|nr:acetyl-CoA C-acetyltransferase [Naumannella cuiyingiana]